MWPGHIPRFYTWRDTFELWAAQVAVAALLRFLGEIAYFADPKDFDLVVIGPYGKDT